MVTLFYFAVSVRKYIEAECWIGFNVVIIRYQKLYWWKGDTVRHCALPMGNYTLLKLLATAEKNCACYCWPLFQFLEVEWWTQCKACLFFAFCLLLINYFNNLITLLCCYWVWHYYRFMCCFIPSAWWHDPMQDCGMSKVRYCCIYYHKLCA